MPIEMYGSDEAGHLMLLPDPTPERTPGAATAPPPGEPPLPGADAAPPPAADVPPAPAPPPADDLAALRRLIEEREYTRAVQEAKRDAQVDTMTRLLRGEDLTPPPAAPAGPKPRPTAETFQTQDEYVEAVADWKAEEKLTTFRQEQQQAQQQVQQAQWQARREAAVQQAETAFAQAHPDYQEKVRGALAGKLAPQVHTALMLFDEAPVIAYAMAQDAALVERLNAMPPPQLLYAMGRLSGQNGGSAPAKASTETVPPAGAAAPDGGLPPGGVVPGAPVEPGRPKPPPPRPLSGTGVAPVGGYNDQMSMSEYRRWRQHGG